MRTGSPRRPRSRTPKPPAYTQVARSGMRAHASALHVVGARNMARHLNEAVEQIEREARWYDDVAGSALSPVAAAESRGRSAGLRSAARAVRSVEGYGAPSTLSLRVEAVEHAGASVVIVEGESDEGLVRA